MELGDAAGLLHRLSKGGERALLAGQQVGLAAGRGAALLPEQVALQGDQQQEAQSDRHCQSREDQRTTREGLAARLQITAEVQQGQAHQRESGGVDHGVVDAQLPGRTRQGEKKGRSGLSILEKESSTGAIIVADSEN